MKLDGKSSAKEDNKKDKKELHLVKGNAAPVFPDEWDFLIENYAYGVSHPEIVDSIEQMAFNTGEAMPVDESGSSSVAKANLPSVVPGQGHGGETVSQQINQLRNKVNCNGKSNRRIQTLKQNNQIRLLKNLCLQSAGDCTCLFATCHADQ